MNIINIKTFIIKIINEYIEKMVKLNILKHEIVEV